MFKSSITAAAFSVLAGAASAATVGFELVISDNNNVPTYTLTNTSVSASITDFSFSIGDADNFNFDGIENLSGPAGGTASITTGDTNLSGGGRFDVIELAFTGFTTGLVASWGADVDVDSSNTVENFRDVLFNNGAADNSLLTATFSDGQVVDFTLPDNATTQSSYTFAASAVAPVPLPAGLPMLIGGLAVLGWMRRRA